MRQIRTTALAIALICVAPLLPAAPSVAAEEPCGTGGNAITCENSLPGAPSSEWDVAEASPNIEGFASGFSYTLGDRVDLKVRTVGANYTVDVYRLGYYGGAGARKMPITVTPTAQTQPDCLTEATTGLVDCGNWAVSASFTIPDSWVSGIYQVHLVRSDTGEENQVVFLVRNDSSRSDVLFQTSDTSWQAYNKWGGNSLYTGEPIGRAYKVSYNRPFSTRSTTPWGRDFVFANEYPMVRFLERNGYDVSYFSGIDADRRGDLIRNHQLYVTTGHDEYWSGQQRANVEAARDAGVNLAFFAGNDVYWKTRWESSIDGSGASHRTLVTYKSTHESAQTDPTGTWTGTWRDPRFSPPADGGRPENALTGTIFTVNSGTNAIQVPAADGRLRLWRNTTVATQADGATATLSPQTLGYEWNEDLDNGSRPAGLFRLSSSTYSVPEKLTDYGHTVAPGTATHALTLYRAPSGAKVFSAGTVQWSWGLDSSHDGDAIPVDARMQQATVNLFADQGAQPASLMTGLVPAAPSTDSTAPTAVISAPAAGTSVRNGSTVTVTGTASDAGGGQVAGVEVSTDGGTSWHPAAGRGSWTYRYDVTGTGPVSIRARAVDDSGNLQGTPASVALTAACPCSVFGASQAPASAAADDATGTELGLRFSSSVSAWVSGVRFYKHATNTGVHTGTLWSAAGAKLATVTFGGESASGWQTATFATAVPITAGTEYVVSYFAPNGRYAADAGTFAGHAIVSAPLTAPATTATAPNGVFRSGSSGFPTDTYQGGNYWVDPVVTTIAPPDTTPPTVTSLDPLSGASSVAVGTAPAVVFSEPVVASTVTMTLATAAGAAVAGTASVSGSTATFTPSAPLASGTGYKLTVSGAKDSAGNAMAALTAPFTTATAPAAPGVCPCTIWDDTTVPAVVAVNDPAEVELGVKFRASAAGKISGLRFYKGAGNTGSHVGTLWSSTGTELGSATFTGESTSGWQTVTFAAPVAVLANTTYVASYHTTTGNYAATAGGLSTATLKGPLTALRSGEDGPNGVYRYGARGFPSTGGDANYWVDVVYSALPDLTAPAVGTLSPGSSATGVPTSTAVRVTYSEKVTGTGITFSLKTPAGAAVAGTGAVTADGSQYAFTPAAALAAGTTYTASIAGARDAAGNVQASTVTWSFTTSGVGTCPCSLFSSDALPQTAATSDVNATELGLKFTATVSGYVTGVRFYKGTGNTGTHTGTLWTSAGGKLASVTFSAETATGWQKASFTSPVPVTAGTQYLVSYFAPNGHYAADGLYFAAGVSNPPLSAPASVTAGGNGVYLYSPASAFPTVSYNATNYWVDAVFTTQPPADTRAPQLVSLSPTAGQTAVPVSGPIRATFDEPLQTAPLRLVLTPAGKPAVAGLVTYDAVNRSVLFAPAAALITGTTYTATLTGVKDAAGNTAPTVSWTFTTVAKTADGCPCSIWPTGTPTYASWFDSSPTELGVKFRADRAGQVRGIRFYKGGFNGGTHVGKLWSSTGTLLASATFTGETASGWQKVLFATPIAVRANTTYVASYYAPQGNYAMTPYGLFNRVDSVPLHALAYGTDGPNGLSRYGYGGGFPTAGNGSNFWVDVVFE